MAQWALEPDGPGPLPLPPHFPGRAEPEIRARTLPALPATPFQDKGRCELQWFELVKIFIKTHCLDLCASTLKFPYFFGELCWLQPFQLRSAWIGSAYSEPSITGRLEPRARGAPGELIYLTFNKEL